MIKIYSKLGCAYCVAATSLCAQKGVPFVEIKIGQDIDRDEFVKEHPDIRSAPAIFDNDEFIGGFEELKERLA